LTHTVKYNCLLGINLSAVNDTKAQGKGS